MKPFQGRTRWTTELLQSPHPPTLKRLLLGVEDDVRKAFAKTEHPQTIQHTVLRELRGKVKHFAHLAAAAGKEWVNSIVPPKKTAAAFDWDVNADIDRIMGKLLEAPSEEVRREVHEALSKGKGAGEVARKLERQYQADRATDIARTVYMNVYSKSGLQEMKKHGYSLARRLEIHDHKTCALCEVLNHKVYDIDALLELPDPLTHDTHPRCRGTFVPVINESTVIPEKSSDVLHTQDLPLPNGGELKDVPREFVPYLRSFARRARLPFSVVFDPDLTVDSRMGDEELRIHPRALYDQDPRELITEAWAEELWPKYEDRFRNEYLLLTHMGLVRPTRSVKTIKEYWIAEFTAYKMNQLDAPWEVLWFRNTVEE